MGYMVVEMADRKNLKISEETFEMLAARKHEGETWNGFFRRILDDPDPELEDMIRGAVRNELRRFVEEREQE